MLSIILMSPGTIAFHLGPIAIRWYALAIFAGFVGATWAASKIINQRGIKLDHLLDCALLAFFGGIVGARLYYSALFWQTFSSPLQVLQLWRGGMSIHGGIIGGVIVGYIFCRRAKISFLAMSDIFGAVIPLAQAIGRWGNFFNSEAFGRPVISDFPIKLYIPEESRPPAYTDFQFFEPTFLYESLWNLSIFGVLYLVILPRTAKYPGMTFLAYLLMYSVGRALIEPMRTDSAMVGGFAAPLVVSGGLAGLALLLMLLLRRHYQKQQDASPQEKRLNETHSEEKLTEKQ